MAVPGVSSCSLELCPAAVQMADECTLSHKRLKQYIQKKTPLDPLASPLKLQLAVCCDPSRPFPMYYHLHIGNKNRLPPTPTLMT